MAKDFPYFKFFVSEWILGRISDHSDKVQGAFIIAICHYWHKKCDVSVIDFKKKLGKIRFDSLVNLKFIEVENDKIFIDFLDEQYREQFELHPIRVKSGQAGGIASAQAKAEAKVKHLDKDKNKIKNKNKIIPTLDEFLEYSKAEVNERFASIKFSLEAKYKSWVANDWRDGYDKPIKNWKSKLLNTIPHLKPDASIQIETEFVQGHKRNII